MGSLSGQSLREIPSRLESFARFRERAPQGRVLVPNNPSYGLNPYAAYDSADQPFLYRGEIPKGVEPMVRVVAIGGEAWSLELLSQHRRIETRDLVITWEEGQASALDRREAAPRGDGNILVPRRIGSSHGDAAHIITFAFAFFAFYPGRRTAYPGRRGALDRTLRLTDFETLRAPRCPR